MNNWETNPDHTVVYDGKINYDEATGMNEINNYEGIGGFEPLMVRIPTEEGESYNFSYKYTSSPYNSWHGVEMHTYVANFYDIWTSHSGLSVEGDVLATYSLPFDGTSEEKEVNLEFIANQDAETVVFQFGDVNDGALGFWFHFSDMKLQKLNYPETYPVINIYKPLLEELIPEVEAFNGSTTEALRNALDQALQQAKAVVGGDDMEAQRAALENLRQAFNDAKAINSGAFDALVKTIAMAKEEGLDTSDAEDFIANGTSQGQLDQVLRVLRDNRKTYHAEKQPNVFYGHDVQAGDFYLYNVGQQRFLTGGSDWGAHAALGINTHLQNGEENGIPKVYLTYRGYCDGPKAGAWRFVKLPNGNYNILQADYPDVYVKFNPYASVDGGNGDYSTVGTEERNVTEDDLDAQWILVSVADRDALLEKATADAPADASYKIVNPGFNQRAEVEPAWQIFNGSVWGRGGNHSDFALESWNTNDCSFSTSVPNLKPGFYLLSVQGFYRDGHHSDQARLITEEGVEPAQNAYVYCGMKDVLLPNIVTEANKAPGLGNMTSVGEYPDGIDQACQFFQLGLYKSHLLVEIDASGILDIGVAKDMKGHEGDWVVVDNFRLTYFGASQPTDEQIENFTGIDNPVIARVNGADGKIYNLQGMQVTQTVKGHIYIMNGKKFISK